MLMMSKDIEGPRSSGNAAVAGLGDHSLRARRTSNGNSV